MRVNCFDDPNGQFLVLVNDERQHSLWPGLKGVPAGWQVVQGPDTRGDCLAYIEENWTDPRAKSLIESTSRRGD
ncbi:MbtH family protein [Streptomyces sp. bgisy084]|uniref:MbtH family protein n=1 Tax=unclassified Streptomyces TaxID=2593676 RepID=UPI003D734D7E